MKWQAKNRLEIWGNHTEDHFLITVDDNQPPSVDIIFIPQSSGEYVG